MLVFVLILIQRLVLLISLLQTIHQPPVLEVSIRGVVVSLVLILFRGVIHRQIIAVVILIRALKEVPVQEFSIKTLYLSMLPKAIFVSMQHLHVSTKEATQLFRQELTMILH